MAAAPRVEFRGVNKTYDGRTMVVQDLDLRVEEGEFFTLLGPSGSGRTTCLMMLAGFEAPSSGEIRLSGRSVQHLPPRKRGIGLVFQNYALFPHMTVERNLAFPLEVRGISTAQRRERIQEALKAVRLSGLENRRPGELSGGQQQRVAIARALVFNPALVLMDEPLGALDRRLREQMQFEIRRMQHNLGITVVYVTHDQQEAMAMSSRVAVFHRGRIQQVAAPETLYEEPEREFVASFIGDNNVLRGRIRAVGRDFLRCRDAWGNRQSLPGTPLPSRVIDRSSRSVRSACILPSRASIPTSLRRPSKTFSSLEIIFDCVSICAETGTLWLRFKILQATARFWKGIVFGSAGASLDCRALPDEDGLSRDPTTRNRTPDQ